MAEQGKEIRRVLATWKDGDESRAVEVQGVENGKAFVQPTHFDPRNDEAIYYHGWETPVTSLSDIYFMYVDGTREFMGNPPVNQ